MTTTKRNRVVDGVYYLHPDGGAWTGVEYRGGRVRATWEEADMGSHDAAGDRHAGRYPSESDVQVGPRTAVRIIADVMPRSYPEMVMVVRAK